MEQATKWPMPALTDEEKRILQGEEGTVKQKCMQYLVELCRRLTEEL